MPDYTQLLKAERITRHKSDGYTWLDFTTPTGVRKSIEVNCFWRGCYCHACTKWRIEVGEPYTSDKDIILNSEYIKPTVAYNNTSCYGWRGLRDSREESEQLKRERMEK